MSGSVANVESLLGGIQRDWGLPSLDELEGHTTPDLPKPPRKLSEIAPKSAIAAVDDGGVALPRRTSWSGANLEVELSDDFTRIEPTKMCRTDGVGLFYAGLTHDLHGESESGKSWIAQCAVAESLMEGGKALYIDFESDCRSVAIRLVDLGVPVEVLKDRTRFLYLRPDSAPVSGPEKDDFGALFDQQWEVAVIDGVTNALTILGLDGNQARDVSQYNALLAERLAVATGAAVIQVDHVPKNSETRRGSIGSVHKLNAITGASYLVVSRKSLARGSIGLIEVRVSKDRPGAVRKHSGPLRKGDQTQQTAMVEADGTGDTIRFTFSPPEQARLDSSDWRPTVLMEAISKHLEGCDEAQNLRAVRGKVKGKAETKSLALDCLVEDGFVSEKEGPRNAKLYESLKPYRAPAQ